MALSDIFEKYPERQYIMYGGKGGLGKTTFSAATAYYLAKKGKRVLVFSVDPQASLSDIFERDIFGHGNIEIMPNLYACEVDADRRVQDYQEEIRQKIISMYGMEKIPEEIESYIKASSAEPAMEESAIFDAVVDIVVKADRLLKEGEEYEAGLELLRAHRGAPKNKRLMKLTHEPGTKKLMTRVEMDFMRDKRMSEIDEVLYFSIDEKSNVVDLTEKGRQALSPKDPELFVLPDLAEGLSRIEGDVRRDIHIQLDYQF